MTTKQYGNQIMNRLDILNQNRVWDHHIQSCLRLRPRLTSAASSITKQVSDGKMSPATADAKLAAISA